MHLILSLEHFSKILAQELEGNGISKLVSSGKVVPRVVNLFYSPFGRERVGIIRTERGLESGGEILNPEGMCWKEWSKENAGSFKSVSSFKTSLPRVLTAKFSRSSRAQ